jgi:hypothetical protein
VVVDGRNRRGDGENWTETAASGSSLSTHDSLLLVHLLAHPIRLPALPGPVSCDCARLSKKIWSWRTPAPSLRSQPSGACGLEDYCAYRTLDSSLNSSQLFTTLRPDLLFSPPSLHFTRTHFNSLLRLFFFLHRLRLNPTFFLTSSYSDRKPSVVKATSDETKHPANTCFGNSRKPAHLLVPGFTKLCSLHLTVSP